MFIIRNTVVFEADAVDRMQVTIACELHRSVRDPDSTTRHRFHTEHTEHTEPKEHTMAEINTDVTKVAKDIANAAKDATYVVIGAGVLGFQQAQVQRREFMAKMHEPSGINDRFTSVRGDLTEAVHTADAKVEDLMDRVEEIIERVEAVFAPFENRLPAQARDLSKQAREQAKDARTQIRSMRPTTVA